MASNRRRSVIRATGDLFAKMRAGWTLRWRSIEARAVLYPPRAPGADDDTAEAWEARATVPFDLYMAIPRTYLAEPRPVIDTGFLSKVWILSATGRDAVDKDIAAEVTRARIVAARERRNG